MLCALDDADVVDNGPTVRRSDLRSIARHEVLAHRDHVVDQAIRIALDLIRLERRWARKARAARDRAVAFAVRAVANDAVRVVHRLAADEDFARRAKRVLELASGRLAIG